MKRIILCLFLTAILTGTARADIFDTLSSAPKDKYVHFCAGTVISHVSYPLFHKHLKNKDDAWLYSLGLVALASVGKEVYDNNKKNCTGFSYQDI